MKKLGVIFAILLIGGCSYFKKSTLNEKSDTTIVSGQLTLIQKLPSANFANNQRIVPLTLGFGSGAYHRPGDPDNIFYTVTDRGPNIACIESETILGLKEFCGKGHDMNKIFPLADFTPLIVKHEIHVEDGKLLSTAVESIALKDSNGKKITGLTNNLKSTNTEMSFGIDGKRLPWDNNGLDTEAIVRLNDNTYWLTEEYGPSLLHVSTDGTILQRVVPESVAKDLQDANYPVNGLLPDIYKTRTLNRGIESLAISPEENYLYFIMQSPLSNPDTNTFSASRTVRMMKYALKNGELGNALGEYTYIMDTPQTFCDLTGDVPQGDHLNGTAYGQSLVKISEMVAVGEDDLIILERISKVTKLYRVHLSTGDNILGTPISSIGEEEAGTHKTLEQIWDLSSVNATPVRKVIAYNSLTDHTVGINLPSKIEGIALLNQKQVLLINDNDFGISGQETIATILPIAERLTTAETRADHKPQMTLIGRYSTGLFDQGSSEIVTYHPESKRIFTVNAEEKTVDVLDASGLNGQALTDPYRSVNMKKLTSIKLERVKNPPPEGVALE
ncbi:MAG: esterase-like activity of phytase family protein [Desulfobacteraceae bacterium]|jgi:hypothetical protein